MGVVNTENISLGVCDVVYDGIFLGATKGGVTVAINTETYEVKVDQFGETPVKEIIMGTTVTVTVPMAETDLEKLKKVMPQGSLTAAAAAPAGWTVDAAAGAAVGATSVAVDGGTGTIAVGHTFRFAGHTTLYRVTAVAGSTITFVQADSGTAGLVAPVADAEVITFFAKGDGIVIASGVNIDLLAASRLLKLHPTGFDIADTKHDFTVFKAAPTANFSFKYEHNSERVYEVTFKAYPDVANNNRIAAFGAT